MRSESVALINRFKNYCHLFPNFIYDLELRERFYDFIPDTAESIYPKKKKNVVLSDG